MDEDVTAFARRLAGRDVAPSGELRITTTDTLYQNVLLPIFAAFRKAHPLIRLDVVIGNQALNLSKRDADIAIRASDTPGETLVGRRIATIAWAIYGRAVDGITAEEEASPALLYQRDWVALGDQLSHVKAARFVREHVAPERIALKSSAVLGIAEAVAQGLGIGPLPCFIADQRPDLMRLLPPNPDFATGLWVLTHPDIRHVPRVRAFMDFCSNELTRQRTLFEG
jgi:DNA-binding transcriptional LysR family regulator